VVLLSCPMTRDENSSHKPGTKVTFPDGTSVYALHIDSRNGAYPPPDFGLYLDRNWAPTWNAVVIPWKDFRPLKDPETLFREIRLAFERARTGQWVEVGCLAGCGRTGTVLACMAVLSGVPAGEAVNWVRSNYDQDAIETANQFELIDQFSKRP
jgi:hypothetical protein